MQPPSYSPPTLDIVDAHGLAALIGLGCAKSVNNRISRGVDMPRHFFIPGSRKRYWRVAIVRAWLDQFPLRHSRRGRPRKHAAPQLPPQPELFEFTSADPTPARIAAQRRWSQQRIDRPEQDHG